MGGIIEKLGIAGSLRRKSYNRSGSRAAVSLRPQGAQLDTFELDNIPAFIRITSTDRLTRCVLSRLLAKLQTRFSLSPEYNYSVPGVLKNAIDWASPALWGQRMGREDGWRDGLVQRGLNKS